MLPFLLFSALAALHFSALVVQVDAACTDLRNPSTVPVALSLSPPPGLQFADEPPYMILLPGPEPSGICPQHNLLALSYNFTGDAQFDHAVFAPPGISANVSADYCVMHGQGTTIAPPQPNEHVPWGAFAGGHDPLTGVAVKTAVVVRADPSVPLPTRRYRVDILPNCLPTANTHLASSAFDSTVLFAGGRNEHVHNSGGTQSVYSDEIVVVSLSGPLPVCEVATRPLKEPRAALTGCGARNFAVFAGGHTAGGSRSRSVDVFYHGGVGYPRNRLDSANLLQGQADMVVGASHMSGACVDIRRTNPLEDRVMGIFAGGFNSNISLNDRLFIVAILASTQQYVVDSFPVDNPRVWSTMVVNSPVFAFAGGGEGPTVQAWVSDWLFLSEMTYNTSTTLMDFTTLSNSVQLRDPVAVAAGVRLGNSFFFVGGCTVFANDTHCNTASSKLTIVDLRTTGSVMTTSDGCSRPITPPTSSTLPNTSGGGSSATTLVITSTTTTTGSPNTASETESPSSSILPLIVIAVVAAVCLICCLGSFIWIRRKKQQRKQSSESLSSAGDNERSMSIRPDNASDDGLLEVSFGKKIGQGAFGEVFVGKFGGAKCALKTIQSSATADADFEKELAVLKKVNHPHLIRFFGVAERDGNRVLVLEYAAKGSLDAFLSKHRGDLPQLQLVNFTVQAATGLSYLHGLGIIHRDIAARNCLVSGETKIKLSDFGMSKTGLEYESSGKIPVRWSSPEVLDDGVAKSSGDVYSFGVLAWEIFSEGLVPYHWLNSNQAVVKAIATGQKLPQPALCPDTVYNEVLLACWHEDAEDRPATAKVQEELDSIYKALKHAAGQDDNSDSEEHSDTYATPQRGQQSLPASSMYARTPNVADVYARTPSSYQLTGPKRQSTYAGADDSSSSG